MGRTGLLTLSLVAMVLVPTSATAQAPSAAPCPRPTGSTELARIAGDDRVATAIDVAEATRDDGEDLGEVVIVADDAFPDATVGAVLGAGLGVPVLLTGAGGLDPAVRDAIRGFDRDDDGGIAYLVGGTRVLEPGVAEDLDALGFTPERLDGEDRYDTARRAAEVVESRADAQGLLVVATGRNWPDAAAGAALASAREGVLRLIDGRDDDDPDFTDGREVVVVGGPEAVSEAVLDRIRARAASVERLAGGDRVATAAAVAEDLAEAPVVLATATGWPDPAVGATLAAHLGGAVLLTWPDALPRPTASLVAGREVTVLGGTVAIPEWLASDAADAATAPPGAPVVLDQTVPPCSVVTASVDRPTTFQLTTNGSELRLDSVTVTPESGETTSGIASTIDRDEGGVLQFFLEVTPQVAEPHDVAIVLIAQSEDGATRTIRRGWRMDVGPTVRTAPEGWRIAGGSSAVAGTAGPVTAYTVEIADGLEEQQDLLQFAAAVEATLHESSRGWTSTGQRRLQRVDDPGAARIRVLLATPGTVDRLCARRGLDTAGIYSCWNGEFAALNSDRWFRGVGHVPDLQLYRNYLVNHEVGHGLGFGHRNCPGEGLRAPIMMQLTKSTYGCEPYGWPY